MYFYEILQNIMDEKNLTIAEVARLSNLTDSTVRSIISRKNKTVALEVAFKLSKGLNVPIEYLADIKDNPNREQENHIIKNYRSLNQDGQAKLIDYSDDLVSSGRYNKEETVKVFMAARNGAKPGIVEIKKSLMDKLKNAPTVESDDDI